MRSICALPRSSTLLRLAVMTVLVFAGHSQAASAITGFGRIASFGAGEFPEGPGAVAVNQSSGDVYVVDHGSQVVRRYDGEGKELLGSWGVASPSGVAVDDSKGESAGDVYVLSNAEGEIAVKKFDGEGKALGEVKETEAGTPFTGLSGLTVDKEGDLWVQQSSGEVDRFDGTKANKFLSAAFTAPEGPCTGAFAIDENEHLYLPIGCASEQFSTVGEDLGQLDANFVAGVTTEPETNDVFANDGYQVSQYNEKREPLSMFGSGVLSGCSAGIAINHTTQHVYVADPCNSQVFVFAPVTFPSVTIDPPTGITATHADFSGTVNPEGTEPPNETTWHFEYSTDNGESWTQTSGGTLEPATSPVTVKDEVSLLPNQHVQVRLAATDAAGTVTSKVEPEDEFDTPALEPDVTTQPAQDLAPDHATLKGVVHPHNSPTTYYFEYGTTTAYGTSLPATQDAPVHAVNDSEIELRPVHGLLPGTTYHYRIVAANSAGTVHGEDATFTTSTAPGPSTGCGNEAIREAQHSQFLPECRAYERVSPSDKNGGDIMADSQRARVATNGNAASYPSLAAFGNAHGTGVSVDYASVRSTTGWSTHAITPPQVPEGIKPIFSGLQSLYSGAFSDDLSHGVFTGVSPVTSDSNVADVPNIYLRSDVTTPGSGVYTLLSACPLCESTSTPLPPLTVGIRGGVRPYFVGASVDFGHVIFESQRPLTSDVPGICASFSDTNACPGNLYEWDHGAVRLVGILPDGTPAHGSQAGQGAGAYQVSFKLTPHAISADGSRIFFTVPSFSGSQSGALYMRLNHTSTVQLNVSERVPPDGASESASYWGATPDGSYVFFTSNERLTDDAVGSNTKLYRYDTTKPASDPHNLTLISVDHEPADGPGGVQTVLGSSDDGHYVYFASSGELASGEPLFDSTYKLYVWHDGTIRYIAPLDTFPNDSEDTNTAAWEFFRPVARVTPDGLHLLYSSTVPGPAFSPTGYDQGHCADTAAGSGCRELYVYSFATDRSECASCNPSGAPATASATTAQRALGGGAVTSSAQNHPLTDDGRQVFFATAEALVPQDVNGRMDVYDYDVSTGTPHLITTGTENADSYFMNATPSGSDVFFVARQRLVGADADSNYDMYDARVDGGFTEPPPPLGGCAGDSCQGPQSGQPGGSTFGSSLVTGAGNLTPAALAAPGSKPKPKPVRCRRGHVRRKVKGKLRCVRKRGRHATAKAKHARSHRRAR